MTTKRRLPSRRVQTATANPLPESMSRQQVKDFFGAIDSVKWRAAFMLCYYFGLRRSELERVLPEDLDMAERKFTVHRSKGGNKGVYPIPDECFESVRAWMAVRDEAPGAALFTSRSGDITTVGISERFKHYAKKAGLPVKYHVHSLRHSIATHSLEIGLPAELVQDLLGHRNIKSTMVYARVTSPTRINYCDRIAKGLVIGA